LPHGQKWDIDATDRHMFDSAETNTIVEYYGHLPSVVGICICMILPTWELKAQKICLGSQPCTPCFCVHDSPQLTKQVPIRLVNNVSLHYCHPLQITCLNFKKNRMKCLDETDQDFLTFKNSPNFAARHGTKTVSYLVSFSVGLCIDFWNLPARSWYLRFNKKNSLLCGYHWKRGWGGWKQAQREGEDRVTL
jgi:hypothetical protein